MHAWSKQTSEGFCLGYKNWNELSPALMDSTSNQEGMALLICLEMLFAIEGIAGCWDCPLIDKLQ